MESEAEGKRLAARLEVMDWLVGVLREDDPDLPQAAVEVIVAPIVKALSAERKP